MYTEVEGFIRQNNASENRKKFLNLLFNHLAQEAVNYSSLPHPTPPFAIELQEKATRWKTVWGEDMWFSNFFSTHHFGVIFFLVVREDY